MLDSPSGLYHNFHSTKQADLLPVLDLPVLILAGVAGRPVRCLGSPFLNPPATLQKVLTSSPETSTTHITQRENIQCNVTHRSGRNQKNLKKFTCTDD